MNIAILGAGYVGTPAAAVFAKFNPNTKFYVLDNNPHLIKRWNSGDYPFVEKNLDLYIQETLNKNLFFTDDPSRVYNDCSIYYLCVNTSTKSKGIGKGYATDLSSIINCVEEIANYYLMKKFDKELIIVEKSTVPLKTSDVIYKIVTRILKANKEVLDKFCVISNPEFLAEGELIRPCYRRLG